MNCTINTSSTQVESLWNDDYEEYSHSPDTSSTTYPFKVRANSGLFEEWMTASPTSWTGNPFNDTSIPNGPTEGACNPINGGSWSPFAQSLMLETQSFPHQNESRESMDEPFLDSPLQTAFEINWSPEDLVPVVAAWDGLPSSAKHSPSDDGDEDYQKSETDTPALSPASTEESERPITPVPRRKAKATRSYTTTKRTKKETSSTTEAKLVKRRRLTTSSPEDSLASTKSKPKLRSISSSCSSADSRTNHNLIEKQYRNRLNQQFESLLETLPKDIGEKRVGKAEVLVNAKQYIQDLEQSLKAMEQKNAGLEQCMKSTKRKWLGLGGCAFRKDDESVQQQE